MCSGYENGAVFSLRNVDHDRPGTPGARDVESLLHRQRQLAHVLDEEVVLDDRPRDADRVALLERIEADRRRRHLAGDDDHRDRVHIGGGDAGHGIGDARAGGHQRNADLAGRTRVAVGSVDCGLFMTHQHMLDRLLFVQGVLDIDHGTAWIAPEVLDPFGLQAANQDFRAVDLGGMGVVEGRRRLHRGSAFDFRGRHVHFLNL